MAGISSTVVTMDYHARSNSITTHQGITIHRVASKNRYTQRYNKKGTKHLGHYAMIAFRILQKVFFEYSPIADPYYSLHKYIAENSLLQNNDIMIITGGPFMFFRIGYNAHKTGQCPWIADYRDDWSTNELNIFYKTWAGALLRLKERRLEKKWLPTARFFTVASPYLLTRIQDKIADIPGYTIENGYITEEHLAARKNTFASTDRLKIAYLGSVLPSQALSEAVKILSLAAKQADVPITLTFIGSPIKKDRAEKLKRLVPGADMNIIVTPRVDRLEALAMLYSSHALLMMNYSNIKGIPASKLYEYLATRLPVFLFYDDKDIITQHLTTSGQGYIYSDDQQALDTTTFAFSQYKEKGHIPLPSGLTISAQYDFSRKAQTLILANHIKEATQHSLH